MAFGTLVSRSKYYKSPKVVSLVQELKDAGVIDSFYDEHFTPGVIKRTEYIQNFLTQKFTEKPDLKVVQVGCGFSTYYYDLPHSPTVKWINSDLSSVTMIRYTHWDEQFDPTLNNHLITLDLNEDIAIDYLASLAKTADVLLAEGVLMYVPKERAKEIVSMGWKNIVFDVLGSNRQIPLGKNHLWTYTENEWDLNITNKMNFDGDKKDSWIYTLKGK